MNLAVLGFLDVSAFAATYVQKHRTKPHPLILRTRDSEPTAILNEWKSAKALLTRIRNAAAQINGGAPAELGEVSIDTLPPGVSTPWEHDETEYRAEHQEIRVCIIPSPGAWTYSGGEGLIIPWGQIVAVNRSALCSDVNFGGIARTHLVIDLKRPA